MLAVAQDIATVALEPLGQPPITTTLYDLIASLNVCAEPGEEDVVTAAVMHLCNTGRVTFLGAHKGCKVVCA